MDDKAGISVDVVSDVVCPWCYVGMKRLDQARTLAPDLDVAVNWRPYQLDPSIPAGGVERRAYMLAKFGSEERLREAHDRLVSLGAGAGIDFDFGAIKVSPNTLDAHRVIRWAGSPKSPEGAQPKVVAALFRAYFEQGRDIGDHAVLAEIAEGAGMDRALVEVLLASPADADAVRSEIETAQRMGVSGVPCYLLEGRYAVMGAQDAETLADAMRQVAGAKARGELDPPPASA